MNHSEQIDQLATALSAAQREFTAVTKDGENPHFRSKFASLSNAVLTAMPVLTSHGLSVSQDPDFDGTHDLLTTTIMHKSGQWKSATMRLHLVKLAPQDQGSALTYAKRYSFMAALGLVADEDDDAEAATNRTKRPRSSPSPAARAPSGESRPPLSREEIERRRQEALAKAGATKDGEPFT